MGETNLGSFYLHNRPVLELVHCLKGLANTGASEGVTAGKKTTISIHGYLTTKIILALFNEGSPFTFLSKSQFLHFNKLRNGKAVVSLGNVNIIWSNTG